MSIDQKRGLLKMLRRDVNHFNQELNRRIEKQDHVEECKNLSDLLSIHDPRHYNVSPESENNSEKKNDLKNHNP